MRCLRLYQQRQEFLEILGGYHLTAELQAVNNFVVELWLRSLSDL